MKIRKYILLFLLALGALPLTAQAQYYDYRSSGRPSIEVNIDVIETSPSSQKSSPTLRQPVTAVPLLPKNLPQQAQSDPSEKAAMAKAKPLLKPVFTQQDINKRVSSKRPIEQHQDIKQMRTTPAPKPAARKRLVSLSAQPFPEANIKPPEPKKEAVAAPPPPPQAPAPQIQKARANAVPAFKDLTLAFSGNSSDLSDTAQAKMQNIAAQLQELPATRIQIRAYATGEEGGRASARRISLSRALSVRALLMDQGIDATRVDVRALGSETDKSPLDRVDIVFVR